MLNKPWVIYNKLCKEHYRTLIAWGNYCWRRMQQCLGFVSCCISSEFWGISALSSCPRLCIPWGTCTCPSWMVSYWIAKPLQKCNIEQNFASLDTLPYLAGAVQPLSLRLGRERSNNSACRTGIRLLPLYGHITAEASEFQIKLFLMQNILLIYSALTYPAYTLYDNKPYNTFSSSTSSSWIIHLNY